MIIQACEELLGTRSLGYALVYVLSLVTSQNVSSRDEYSTGASNFKEAVISEMLNHVYK